jgi:hypothetical protein
MSVLDLLPAYTRMENKLLLIKGLLNSDTFSIFRVNFSIVPRQRY